MKLKHVLFAAALAITASQAKAQGFSDTWIGVRDGPYIANAGALESHGGRNVNKIIANFGHFDAGDYGSNFVNADVLFSNANEPAYNSKGGSTEFYGVFRHQFSLDKYLGLNTKVGPFSAITFEVGGDAETENTAFAPDKKVLVAGPNFHFDLPAGAILNVGVHAYKEWNNNGIANCPSSCQSGGPANFAHGGPVSFDPTAEFEIVWFVPLSFTGLPLDFKGFMNIVLPKGKDGFGLQTATEVLTRPQIDLDLGSLMFNKPNKFYAYLQVELWENKFGNDHTIKGNHSMEEVSPVIGIEYHF